MSRRLPNSNCQFLIVNPMSGISIKHGPQQFFFPPQYMDKLDLFKNNPRLREASEYEVKSDVTSSTFQLFYMKILGGAGELSFEHVEGIRALCAEFGFHGFDEELSKYGVLLERENERKMLERLADLESRVNEYPEIFEQLKVAIEYLATDLNMVQFTVNVWEEQLRDLESQCTSLAGDVKKEKLRVSEELNKLEERNKQVQELEQHIATVESRGRGLLENMSKLQLTNKEIKKQYSKKDPLDGLLNTLMEAGTGSGALVRVTASSVMSPDPKHAPINAAMVKQNSVFFSSEERNPWLCYDFMNHRVTADAYVLRSFYEAGENGYHPKSWVIEGSDNGAAWSVLDEVAEDHQLNGKNKIAMYKIKKPKPFKMIRIRSTGPNHYRIIRYALVLSSFELFGVYE